jgi:hypothetical protein
LAGQPVDPFDFDGVVSTAKYTAITAATEAFVKEFAEQGINVKVLSVSPDVSVETEETCSQYRDWTVCTFKHWLHVKAAVTFETDKPLAESPISELVAAVLVKIAQFIIAALVAAFAIYMLSEWLESMTTKTSTITYVKDGQTVTETVTEPSVFGIAGLGGIIILGVVLYALLTRRKE